MLSAWLRSDKYQFKSQWLDLTIVQIHNVQITQTPKMGDGCSSHSAIPFGCSPKVSSWITRSFVSATTSILVFYTNLTKCIFSLCIRMVSGTVECMQSNMAGCTEREQASLNRTLDIVLKTLEGQCDQVVEVRQPSQQGFLWSVSGCLVCTSLRLE